MGLDVDALVLQMAGWNPHWNIGTGAWGDGRVETYVGGCSFSGGRKYKNWKKNHQFQEAHPPAHGAPGRVL